MKSTIFSTLLLLSCALTAQDYSYVITSESGDSTFTLDVVTKLSDTRQSIERNTGLDTLTLQRTQYGRIQALRERQARLHVEVDQAQRQINALLASLNAVQLNQYAVYQRETLDSFYVSDWWRYSDSNGQVLDLYGQYRENNTTVLRLQSDNTAVAVIVPQSPNWVRLNLQDGYEIDGEAFVEVYSNNGRDYRGETCAGVVVRIRKIN